MFVLRIYLYWRQLQLKKAELGCSAFLFSKLMIALKAVEFYAESV